MEVKNNKKEVNIARDNTSILHKNMPHEPI